MSRGVADKDPEGQAGKAPGNAMGSPIALLSRPAELFIFAENGALAGGIL
jgi:hypothetical protein